MDKENLKGKRKKRVIAITPSPLCQIQLHEETFKEKTKNGEGEKTDGT